MPDTNYAQFFSAACGSNRTPYGYQCRLACGPDADPAKPETLTVGTDCKSQSSTSPRVLVNRRGSAGVVMEPGS